VMRNRISFTVMKGCSHLASISDHRLWNKPTVFWIGLLIVTVFMLFQIKDVLSSMYKDRCVYDNNDVVIGNDRCAQQPKVTSPLQTSEFQLVNDIDFNFFQDMDSLSEDINYSRCPPMSTLKVFVRMNDHPLAKALASHPAATSKLSESCVDIEFADGKKSAYSRKSNNSNLLVVNLDPSSTVTANGSVMIAQGLFRPGLFRAGMDLAVHTDVGAFDINQWKNEPYLLPVQREVGFYGAFFISLCMIVAFLKKKISRCMIVFLISLCMKV
ncbi:hypothetical protein PENTCL1PPCAC_29856, partial [Pristionchus entomophagus]